jgi:hypothetical protein
MNFQNEIIKGIKGLSNNVGYITSLDWWYFSYNKYQMVYIPDMGSDTIRICIPHFDKLEKYDFHLLISAINEINRKVKYVKIVVLKNGCISINYDHKYCGRNNNIDVILSHILPTLCFAANTLKAKLSRQTSF